LPITSKSMALLMVLPDMVLPLTYSFLPTLGAFAPGNSPELMSVLG